MNRGKRVARTVALGAHRLPMPLDASRAERLRRSREMLAHALTQETTVAVVGSGCSTPLGYPTWNGLAQELVEKALATLAEGSSTDDRVDPRRRLLAFQGRLSAPQRIDSPELMFAIGLAKRVLTQNPGAGDLYLRYLVDRFRPMTSPVGFKHNPHRALVRMPIDRFVTTNYDCEIERALKDERGIVWEDFRIETAVDLARRARPPLSFTQESDNLEQLALFALAGVSDAKNMVFHCHGRYDHPESVIATEADYQRWYLTEEGEEEAAPAFLQTFDLLFNSNPILFVGFGLGDEDLLRPLRRIAATTPERAPFRPLFALLPEAADGEDWNRHEQLFERYGLNVIPFPAPGGRGAESWGRALCTALTQLEEERLTWRDGWFEKPMFRTVTVRARPPEPYRHYSVDPRGHETLGRARVEQMIQVLKEEALAGARVIGLVGAGGTGKSWHAMRLLEELQRETSAFAGFFFWSSYYADDSLTGLDRMLGYIDPHGDCTVSRLTRLREVLTKSRYLIVLDGFERLLRPTEEPEMGQSTDPVTKRLLGYFAESTSHSTLVLTSRLWPEDLALEDPAIRRHLLTRMRTGDLEDVEPFSWLDRAEVSALCSLLEGHAYALFLAGRFIRQGSRAEAPKRCLDLRRELAKGHPSSRLGPMIDQAVAAAGQEAGPLARALLERLAVFMSPVSAETVERCLALAAESTDSGATMPSAAEMIERLEKGGLLFRVASGPTEREPPAFTAHPTVRSHLFEQADEVGRDVLPNFTLAGFTSSRAAVHPGSQATAQRVRQLFERLHGEAERALEAGRVDVARELCRSLFGMMRSRMESNTVSRWTTYGEYLRYGFRLVDLAKRLSPDLWSFREPHELPEIEHADAPLYADELAFVYNDIGLTLCAEGYMQDTLDIWKEGYEINRILEGTAEVPRYTLQSQLHLGHTFLELGQLTVADQYLKEAEQTNYTVKDLDYSGRILGYQALISYYRGHLDAADTMFAETLRKLREAGGNPRAQSFFLNHRVKLAMVLRRFDQAELFVQSSHALAASIRAEDLLAYTRAALGRLFREQGSFETANGELHAALREARHLGIRRLEAEVLTSLARVALALGDTALARRRAMAALGIANELGLGLRKTQSLLLLGTATVKAGQAPLGAAYLRLAKKLGEEQGYRLRSREAEQQLQALGQEAPQW